ncbi:MAG: OmpA family protein [Gemmatimonadota bacterium]|nr:OmpA family protein [Gemmatimonadota bacterium]
MNRSFRGTGLTGLLITLGLATGACGKKPAEAAPAPAVMASQPAPARNAVRSDPGSTTDAAAEAARRRAVLTEMVFFDYDRAVIRPDQRALLDAKVQVLRQDPDVRLQIDGHADDRGSTEYNLALGLRRANAIKDYFTSFGLTAGRFEVRSYGEERPLERGEGEGSWARNRRGEFVVR